MQGIGPVNRVALFDLFLHKSPGILWWLLSWYTKPNSKSTESVLRCHLTSSYRKSPCGEKRILQPSYTPISLDSDLWRSVQSERAPRFALVWGDLGVPTIRLRPIIALMAPLQGSMRPDGDLITTDRQSTFCKAAIKPDQITLCWLSDATRKRSVCAPMAMLETYGVQFPVWLRCRRPLLIRLRCTRSDYDQIATCWLQSYKCRWRSDAIIDV